MHLDESNVKAGFRTTVGDIKIAYFTVDHYVSLKLKHPQTAEEILLRLGPHRYRLFFNLEFLRAQGSLVVHQQL